MVGLVCGLVMAVNFFLDPRDHDGFSCDGCESLLGCPGRDLGVLGGKGKWEWYHLQWYHTEA